MNVDSSGTRPPARPPGLPCAPRAGTLRKPTIDARLVALGLYVLMGAVSGAIACAPTDSNAPVPRHLVLISVDTLRADHLGAYGSTRGMTPNLDSLARDSTVFERAYAPTPFTLASISALLTGRYPEEVGIASNRSILAPEIPTLAQLLRDAGFETGAVVSSYVLRAGAAGVSAGFDYFDDALPDKTFGIRVPERVAMKTTMAAREMIDRLTANDARFFLWIHYQDPHGPYTPGKENRERFFDDAHTADEPPLRIARAIRRQKAGELPIYQYVPRHLDPEFYRAGYRGEIHRMDRAVGALVEELEERGLLDETVILVVADHGESLGEDDYWFAHGERLHDALLRVPFILRRPGLAAERRSDVSSLVDVLPTLLDALGVEAEVDFSGRNLLAPGAHEWDAPVYLATLEEASRPRFGIVDARTLYVLTPPHPEAELDPERERVFAYSSAGRVRLAEQTEPARRAALRRRLETIRADLRPPPSSHRSQNLSPAEEAQLEALGYIDGP